MFEYFNGASIGTGYATRGMALADEIRTAFQPLIGLQWALARHSGMTVFHFGDVRPAPGGGKVGQFALHIQCPWRVVTPDRIVTGSADYWRPADENLNWGEWEKDGTTRRSSSAPPSLQEKRLLDLFCGYDPDTGACVNITERLVVETVSADNYGGVQIDFSGDYSLQLFPASTCESSHWEHWRLFEPGSDGDHFVAMPNGVLERVGQSSAATPNEPHRGLWTIGGHSGNCQARGTAADLWQVEVHP